MAARAGYTALTPETTVFPPTYIRAPVGSDLSEAIQLPTTTFHRPSAFETIRGAVQGYWDRLREFVDNNAGLLLVALAQLFFSFVNVSVKVLKDIDVPMPTLEVCAITIHCVVPTLNLFALYPARARSNGTCCSCDIMKLWRAKRCTVDHLCLLPFVHVSLLLRLWLVSGLTASQVLAKGTRPFPRP